MALRHILLLLLTFSPSLAFADELQVVKEGDTVEIELLDTGPIFSADYAEYRQSSAGIHKTDPSTWANRPTCRYARAEGPGGFGVFRSCEQAPWEGAYFDSEGGWELSGGELERTPQGHGKCGVDGVPVGLPLPTSTGSPDPRITATRTNFLETTILTDSRLAQRSANGEDVPDPVLSYIAAATLFDGTPFDRRLLPILVGLVQYDSSTPWGAPSFEPTRSGAYLDRLNDWLSSEPADVLNRDVVVLLSGWDFWGSTVGLANVSGACDLGLNGTLVYGEGPLPSVAQTLAHELGHTIGMWHDSSGNSCPNEGFVMQAVYSESGPFPTDFSSCSVESANEWLASGESRCVTTESAPAFPEPYCGDGKVEGDEACDCGPEGCADRNPCCNGDTCQLNDGALCAGEDGCCNLDTCTPRAATEGFVCREAASSCDVAELCTGGAACPDDAVEPTGGSCSDGAWNGACYLGTCVTRGGYCEELAPLYRFDNPPFDEMCGGSDAGCRVMECLANNACVLTEDSPIDGSECGSGSQCIGGNCRPSSQLDSPECLEVTDVDGDGVDACGDDADLCPTDPAKTEPGACGCLVAESDCPDGTIGDSDAGGGDGSDAGGNGGTGGTGGPGGESGGESGGDAVIELGQPQSEDSGCSTAGSSMPAGLIGLFALLLVRRRRR